MERVYAIAHENSGITFVFDRRDRQTHVNSYTFYPRYTGPLPAGNDVKVDITLNERLTFPLRDRPILRGYEEFADLPEARSIDAYSLEEIAAEKTIALADPARNEPRDLYDLWYLTSDGGIEMDHLII
jgi:predicted nucleotidyltransferase component of viral defense system